MEAFNKQVAEEMLIIQWYFSIELAHRFVNLKDYCYCTVFLKNVMRCGGGGGGSEVWWQVLGVYADKVV